MIHYIKLSQQYVSCLLFLVQKVNHSKQVILWTWVIECGYFLKLKTYLCLFSECLIWWKLCTWKLELFGLIMWRNWLNNWSTWSMINDGGGGGGKITWNIKCVWPPHINAKTNCSHAKTKYIHPHPPQPLWHPLYTSFMHMYSWGTLWKIVFLFPFWRPN